MSNREGYRDETADKAIHNAAWMPDHVYREYKALQAIAGLQGFEIVGLRDKKTGKEWRR